jgi:hypothetical protein
VDQQRNPTDHCKGGTAGQDQGKNQRGLGLGRVAGKPDTA